jgi:type II secretory ATPase GspE/PulE/Tfp pilus assembly ATPase PilB-like protein
MLSTAEISAALNRLAPKDEEYATRFVETVLGAAAERPVSDVHLTPTAGGLELRWRSDGVLETIGLFSPGEAADVVTRLKVLADLLTYRQETPQEGRLRRPQAALEMRVSTFPTLHGERAVVRIFRQTSELERLADLSLPDDLERTLRSKLDQTQGAIIVTGPAGSGKTTTVYACLREILAAAIPRGIITLEDPIELELPGAAQSAMQPAAGFDFASALRSVMRQDPEVILVGEVRDRETALAAFQASLTGHLVFTTFHAASAASAVSRLNDMGIEPYLLRSGLQAMIGQRLVRRLCGCAVASPSGDGSRIPAGCTKCGNSGYCGRMALAELLPPLVNELGTLVLAKADAPRLEAAARSAGMVPLRKRAENAVAAGDTSLAEVCRVLGLADEAAGA